MIYWRCLFDITLIQEIFVHPVQLFSVISLTFPLVSYIPSHSSIVSGFLNFAFWYFLWALSWQVPYIDAHWHLTSPWKKDTQLSKNCVMFDQWQLFIFLIICYYRIYTINTLFSFSISIQYFISDKYHDCHLECASSCCAPMAYIYIYDINMWYAGFTIYLD